MSEIPNLQKGDIVRYKPGVFRGDPGTPYDRKWQDYTYRIVRFVSFGYYLTIAIDSKATSARKLAFTHSEYDWNSPAHQLILIDKPLYCLCDESNYFEISCLDCMKRIYP